MIAPPRHIIGEAFLRGPIPLVWLAAAGQQPGKALHVGLYCWHMAFIKNSIRIKVSTTKLQALGVNRQAAYKALAALEQQNLIYVERHQGRCPVVTLLIAGARITPPARFTPEGVVN